MGRHAQPTALKRLNGSAAQHPERINDNEPVPERGIGSAPAHLGPAEQAIWDEVVSVMYKDVLGEADRIALEAMVRLIHMMRTSFDEMTAAQLTRLTGLLGQFGMTPADRTKISVPKRQSDNPFAGLDSGTH